MRASPLFRINDSAKTKNRSTYRDNLAAVFHKLTAECLLNKEKWVTALKLKAHCFWLWHLSPSGDAQGGLFWPRVFIKFYLTRCSCVAYTISHVHMLSDQRCFRCISLTTIECHSKVPVCLSRTRNCVFGLNSSIRNTGCFKNPWYFFSNDFSIAQ